MDLKAETALAMLRKAASILEEMTLPPEDIHDLSMARSIRDVATRLSEQVNADEYVADKIHEKLDELS